MHISLSLPLFRHARNSHHHHPTLKKGRTEKQTVAHGNARVCEHKTSTQARRTHRPQAAPANIYSRQYFLLAWCASRIVVSVTMTPFFCRTHADMASGPLESSTDLAVSGGGALSPDSDPGKGMSGMVGGVVATPGGARPLCADRSPWMTWSARKTASLDGVVEGLAGLDLFSRGHKEEEKETERAGGGHQSSQFRDTYISSFPSLSLHSLFSAETSM